MRSSARAFHLPSIRPRQPRYEPRPSLAIRKHRPGTQRLLMYPERDDIPARQVAINPYVAQFTFTFIQILTWSVIARALISWLPIDQTSTICQVLFRITEPIIEPIRRVLPSSGMIDLSPLAALLLLIVMGQMVLRLSAVD